MSHVDTLPFLEPVHVLWFGTSDGGEVHWQLNTVFTIEGRPSRGDLKGTIQAEEFFRTIWLEVSDTLRWLVDGKLYSLLRSSLIIVFFINIKFMTKLVHVSTPEIVNQEWTVNGRCREESRWRHQMETFSALLVTGAFPEQRLVTRSLNVSFDLLPNKRVSKQ